MVSTCGNCAICAATSTGCHLYAAITSESGQGRSTDRPKGAICVAEH